MRRENPRRELTKKAASKQCSEAAFEFGNQPAMLPSPACAAPEGTFATCDAGTVNCVL